MIPAAGAFFDEVACVPRVGGGDPLGELLKDIAEECSPRRRG